MLNKRIYVIIQDKGTPGRMLFHLYAGYQTSKHVCIFTVIPSQTNGFVVYFCKVKTRTVGVEALMVLISWLSWLPAIQAASQQIVYCGCYGYRSEVLSALIWNSD